LDAKLWNLGVKVADVDREVAFFQELGATLLVREKRDTPAGEVDYALIAFARTRIFLTPKTVFEDALPGTLKSGLTHAVFEVAKLEPEIERLKTLGTDVLLPPTEITAGFGTRRIAFLRSPGGLVFEVMEILEDKVGGS
jgi:catechol 2,3-dioxygenase-like lactoylglutathione lyase family enzyme